MPTKDDPYEKWIEDYDAQSLKCQWHGPALLFGMMYPYMKPGQSLLDLGIGTGLGALSFHGSGLTVIGMDSSPSMLEQCRRRGLPWKLIRHDLAEAPWPIDDDSVDHVVSTGVTHFISHLKTMIEEVSRVMKHGGVFGFDFDEYTPERGTDYAEIESGIYETYNSEYDQHLYRHTEEYVVSALAAVGLRVVHDTEILVSRDSGKYFRVLMTRS